MPAEPCCRIHSGQFLQVASIRSTNKEKKRQRSANHVRISLLPICISKYVKEIYSLKIGHQAIRDALSTEPDFVFSNTELH